MTQMARPGRKHHTLQGDIKVIQFAAPPQAFDPLAASAEELQTYGFPAIPQDARHRARYERVFSSLKHKLNIIEPTFRVNTDHQHGPRKRPTGGRTATTAGGTETSTNWSGAVVYAPSGQAFNWVEGDFVVPNVDAPTEGQWYYAATWIGIDGDGSNDVFQAGVECEVYSSGGTTTSSIYPWWEWYPYPEVQITNLSVGPGDMITILLCSAQGAGSTTGTVYITNRTTGDSVSVGLTAPQGTTLVGNCAEWIVEAPTVGGAQSAIADYGEVFFSVCEAVAGSTTIDGGTGDNINLTAGGSTVSSGQLTTSTVVQCSYTGALP
jgi:hypothetical protein